MRCHRWLCPVIAVVLSGCTASGNLYFLSVQKIGVDVAVSNPASNAMPKITLGYESLKGAINPVKDKGGSLRSQAYSVVGITSANVSGGEDTGIVASEWFATGRAADLIADNPLAPAALAGSRTLTPDVLERATRQQLAQTYAAIDNAYNYLSSLAGLTNEQQALIAGMDSLHVLVSGLQFQTFNAAGLRGAFNPPGGTRWARVTQARAGLSASITFALNRANNGPANARQSASDAAVALESVRAEFDRQLLASPPAQATWNHVLSIISEGK